MRPTPVILLALAAGALLAGCGADEDEPTPSAAAPSPTSTAEAPPTPTEPALPSTGDGTPRPPEASITGGGQTVTAGFGSYCWSDPASGAGVCADSAAPRCDDGYTPRLAVPAGSAVEWLFQFAPAEGPVLTVHGPDGLPADEQPVLPAGTSTQWQVDLPPGEHATSLFVRPTDGGDVSYTACLEVTGDAPTAAETTIEVPAGPSVDEADCATRWNSEANAGARAAAVGPAVGAVVQAAPDGCTVTVMRLADEGGFTAIPFTATSDGRFRAGTPAPASAAGAATWSVDGTGALVARAPSPGAPNAAILATPTNGPARVRWSAYASATESTELALGACGEVDGPVTLRARTGEPLSVALAFLPATTPTLVFEDGREVELVATPAAEWEIDLEARVHLLHVDAVTPDGVEVRYTACLDVTA